MIQIVPATVEHLRTMYPESVGRTVRAFAAVDGDRVLGIGGTFIEQNKTIVFANLTDELRSHRRALIAGVRRVLGSVRGNAYALCDTSIPAADGFLEHFGFTHLTGEVYEWHN